MAINKYSSNCNEIVISEILGNKKAGMGVSHAVMPAYFSAFFAL